MKVFSVWSALSLFYALSQAQNAGIAITAPALGAVWTAGRTEIVSWTIQDPSVSTISSVELRNGGSANLQLIDQMGSALPVSTQQWSWTIPASIKTDSSYVLVFTSSKGTTYSPYFTIMAAAPGAVTNSSAGDKVLPAGSSSSTSSSNNNNSKPSSTVTVSSSAANASSSHSSGAAATAATSKRAIFLVASGMFAATAAVLL